MKAIALDDLSLYTPWPARLLAMGSATSQLRTAQRIEAEYSRGVYARLQEAVQRNPRLTMEQARRIALREPGREVAMSLGPALYATRLDSAMARSEDIHIRRIAQHLRGVRTIVDLGCGYGHLLARFRQVHPLCEVRLRGADIAPSAIDVARHFGVQADVFSFLSDACDPLEEAEPPVLVVTAYALHQLPSAAPAVDLLARYRSKIAAVVCLEPEEDHFGSSLMGLLRHAYGQANGYSADLLRVLQSRGDVTVLRQIPNAVGANALLPGTISAWAFR